MDLSDYQQRAGETDILTGDDELLPLLGLAGEVGQLIAEYKKRQRDKSATERFVTRSMKNSATSSGTPPRSPATTASTSTRSPGRTWARPGASSDPPDTFRAMTSFDKDAPAEQRLPTRLTVTLVETEETTGRGETLQRVRMYRGTQRRRRPPRRQQRAR